MATFFSSATRISARRVNAGPCKFFLAVSILLVTASTSLASTVTATWDKNPETNIAGYKLSYGTASRTYTTTVDVGNVTTFALTVVGGQTYFFAVQAYDTSGQLSPYSTEVSFAVPASTAPTITSLSPASGSVGTAVTIQGGNFGASKGSSTVTFNGTIATPTSWSASSIVVPVPTGATTGNVVVTVGGVASNALAFSVVAAAAPSITSLSPPSGPVGTAVTITGTNFGASKGTSTVTFNGTTATPTSWSASSIVVPVPTGATTGNVVVTVGGVASNGMSYTVGAAATVPAPWVDQDVGAPALKGSASFSGGTFSVTAGGVDIWGTSDQFHFVYQPLNGDGQIVARVATLQSVDPWTKAGVMIRTDLTAGAANALLEVTPGHGITLQGRSAGGGVTALVNQAAGVAPQWIRVTRSGNAVSDYTSPDGTTWTLQGTVTITLPTQVFIGLAVTSHKSITAAKATFSNVTVTPASAAPAARVTSLSASTGSIATPATAATIGAVAAGATNAASRRRSDLLRQTDFDGDGKSDIGVFHPETGQWSARLSTTKYTSNLSAAWGGNTDTPLRGDYDGDGKSDPGIFHPATGQWDILLSSTNYTTSLTLTLGSATDIPVPGDYDGDGKTDPGVFHPATGQWDIRFSSTNYTTGLTLALGGATGIPAPADYDGDGRTDLGIFRPSTGAWEIRLSSTNYTTGLTLALGGAADIAVPADYDGDGKADLAVFRPSTGQWDLLFSSTNYTRRITVAWGTTSDVPVLGDFDGDGKADLGVFHPSTGEWKILFSGAGYTTSMTIVDE
jgi:regulation of enolase protein 1 (concanavalin A-like superfamily)